MAAGVGGGGGVLKIASGEKAANKRRMREDIIGKILQDLQSRFSGPLLRGKCLYRSLLTQQCREKWPQAHTANLQSSRLPATQICCRRAAILWFSQTDCRALCMHTQACTHLRALGGLSAAREPGTAVQNRDREGSL